MIDDDIDKEAEALKAKWGTKAPSALDPADAAIARKLLGRDNAERLASRTKGDPRKFRPAPVLVHYEWHWHDTQFSCGWVLDRIENGRREDFLHGHLEGDLQREISKLQATGATVREVRLGLAPRRKEEVAKPSQRKLILDRLGKFRA